MGFTHKFRRLGIKLLSKISGTEGLPEERIFIYKLAKEWLRAKKRAERDFKYNEGQHFIIPADENPEELKRLLKETFGEKGIIAYPYSFSGEWGDFLEKLGYRVVRIDINVCQLKRQSINPLSIKVLTDADDIPTLGELDGILSFEPCPIFPYSRLWPVVFIGTSLKSLRNGGTLLILSEKGRETRLEKFLKTLGIKYQKKMLKEVAALAIKNKEQPPEIKSLAEKLINAHTRYSGLSLRNQARKLAEELELTEREKDILKRVYAVKRSLWEILEWVL